MPVGVDSDQEKFTLLRPMGCLTGRCCLRVRFVEGGTRAKVQRPSNTDSPSRVRAYFLKGQTTPVFTLLRPTPVSKHTDRSLRTMKWAEEMGVA